MRRRSPASLLLACILLFAAGCSSRAPQPDPPTGSIQGSIAFSPPAQQSQPAPQSTPENPHPSSACPNVHPLPYFRHEDRMLTPEQPPVFLWISAGLPQAATATPRQKAVLTQFQCGFHPRLLGVLPDQPVDFTNSNLSPAHLRVTPNIPGNPTLNLTLRPQKPGRLHAFPRPELLIPVTSPDHPDMRADINVVPNPYFTLSGPKGRFSLRNLPPGTYTLSALRPGFPTQSQSITVQPNTTTHVVFTFSKSTTPSQVTPRN